jgi:hypothetical protein
VGIGTLSWIFETGFAQPQKYKKNIPKKRHVDNRTPPTTEKANQPNTLKLYRFVHIPPSQSG